MHPSSAGSVVTAAIIGSALSLTLAAKAGKSQQQVTVDIGAKPVAQQPRQEPPRAQLPATVSAQRPSNLVLEDGAPVKLRISRTVSSADASVGDTVDFEVLEEVRVADVLVIPKSGVAWATVTEAQRKRRLGRGGKLSMNIDSVRLVDGEKIALRAVKDVKGGGHVGAMTGAIVATTILFWPAAPLFLFMHGKDITVPKGTEITAYINGDAVLDSSKFQPLVPAQQAVAAPATDVAAALEISSVPPSAEIEIDGSFVGNTPSSVAVAAGEHSIRITKAGYKPWERKIRTSSGNVTVIAELKEELAPQQ